MSVSSEQFYRGNKSFKAVYNWTGTTTLLTTEPINLKNLTNYRISAKVYIDALYNAQDAYIGITPQGSFMDFASAVVEPTTGQEWLDIYMDFTAYGFGPVNNFHFTIYASGTGWEDPDTTIYIDDIKLYELDNQQSLCSECFTLKRSHPCSLKLEWWNDNDAYGYKYTGDGFKHTMRVAGSLAKTSYTGEKESFTDTEGEQIIVYADKKQVKELAINDMPEYMHEALAIGIDHDHFTINGDEYIIEEGSYEPQWRKTSDLAPVVLDVRPKTQNLKNSYC